MASANAIQIQWYPRSSTPTLTKEDKDKECKFKFEVEDFKTKGVLKSEPKDGKFHMDFKHDGCSFTFRVEAAGAKPSLKCSVMKLPGEISAPSYELKDNFIIIKMKKKTAGSWKEQLNQIQIQSFTSPTDVSD